MTDKKLTHYEETLQRDIDLIRSKVTKMFQLDKRALHDVLKAQEDNNRQLAYAVILRDYRIDDLEEEIDRLCLEFIVRQQPVALHLRFAYVTIKINQELERIGDYCESIARQILKTSHLDPRPPTDMFREIANLTIPMLEDSINAYLNQDAELAKGTMDVEEKIDEVRDNINAAVYKLQKDGKIPINALNPLMTIARRFERTSDQAKNICEEVVYMVTGEYAKHKVTEMFRILVVDNHGACRSQMAEGIATSMGLPNLIVTGAGLEAEPLDQDTIKFMSEKDVDISHGTTCSVEQVPNLDHYQVIIALTRDAKSVLPKPPTKVIGLEWDCPDPMTIDGSAEEKQSAFEQAYNYLRTNLQDLSEAILGDEVD